jgi:glutamine amidotransferase PdxT
MNPLRRFAAEKPVWGTCAGMILNDPLKDPRISLFKFHPQRKCLKMKIFPSQEKLPFASIRQIR